MNEGPVIQGFSSEEEGRIVGQWNRRRRRLEGMLTPFADAPCSLRLTVRQQPLACEAHAVLMLPTATLTARGRSGDAELAVDQACDGLEARVREHKAALRREFLYHRRHRRRGDLSGILSALQECRAAGDAETFADLLRPALRELSDHARRELQIAHLEEQPAARGLTPHRLMSGLVARAWERFDQRSEDQRLEHWLTGLLHTLIDEWSGDASGEGAPAAMPGTVGAEGIGPGGGSGGPHAGADRFWPLGERLTLADVVPASQRGSAIENASDDEQRAWVLSQLRGLPRLQRRAFALYTLEGWNVDEIAALQGRTAESVLLDIDYVRNEFSARLDGERAVGTPRVSAALENAV